MRSSLLIEHWQHFSASLECMEVTDPAKAIFLSYASQDADAAQRICNSLRAAGHEVWFDKSDLRGGDAWDAAIRKQVKECALFMPLISANTDARSEGYFRREWNLAVNRMLDMAEDQAFLLPVVIDDTPEMTARVPDRFRERQWTRLPRGNGTRRIRQARNAPARVRNGTECTQRLSSRQSRLRPSILAAQRRAFGLPCFPSNALAATRISRPLPKRFPTRS